ncbi:MAG: flagellar motor protein MotA [Alphaproteobacteria bacterium]
MSGTKRYLTRMIVFLAAVAVTIGVLFFPMVKIFLANAALNGLIVLVMIAGIAYAFRQVTRLHPEIDWIEAFRRGDPSISLRRAPVLLAPMASLMRERKGRVSLSTLSMRSLLDSIASRLDESRDIVRYFVGLLVFLGLLGTFWGLLQTVTAVGATISNLSPATTDFASFFDELKAGLEAPLGGMGTAFSSSLFGLAGSLVLGFLELQAGQAQNRFYNDLEEYLSEHTRLGSGAGVAEGDQSVPVYVQALLEQTADSLENLQRTMARGEESRASGQNALLALSERLAALSDQMSSDQNLLGRMVELQEDMRPVLQRLASEHGHSGIDEASRNHLRNLDVYVMRVLEELSEGRNQVISELRSEIKLLARTVAALGDDSRRG